MPSTPTSPPSEASTPLLPFREAPQPPMPTYPFSDAQRRDLAVYLLAQHP